MAFPVPPSESLCLVNKSVISWEISICDVIALTNDSDTLLSCRNHLFLGIIILHRYYYKSQCPMAFIGEHVEVVFKASSRYDGLTVSALEKCRFYSYMMNNQDKFVYSLLLGMCKQNNCCTGMLAETLHIVRSGISSQIFYKEKLLVPLCKNTQLQVKLLH